MNKSYIIDSVQLRDVIVFRLKYFSNYHLSLASSILCINDMYTRSVKTINRKHKASIQAEYDCSPDTGSGLRASPYLRFFGGAIISVALY